MMIARGIITCIAGNRQLKDENRHSMCQNQVVLNNCCGT